MNRLRHRISVGTVHDLDLHTAPPILRPRLLPGTVTTPVDIYAELEEFVRGLSPDERGHFVPKALGAEQGELAWYFVGRDQERRHISTWLRTRRKGMLVVTGRAGVGKSALLGNVLIQANPALRDLLTRAGHMPPVARDDRPPDGVFDTVVQLTGMRTGDLVRRLATDAGLDSDEQSGQTEPGQDVDWLLDSLCRRRKPFTVLADALDEAQEPMAIARSVLRRVAALPHVRVVVGTRASTREGPDQPDPVDEDLLVAVGRTARTMVLRVGRDRHAIATYVTRRLTAARSAGLLDVDDTTIDDVAGLVSAEDREFLYARLAIHEVLARPELLTAGYRSELTDLLSRDHRALFAAAIMRLTTQDPSAGPLLEALAWAQGRGLPRADRIWSIVACALADGDQIITEEGLDHILKTAAPYILLDAEDGQSVYRLSHHTFQEYFLSWKNADRHVPGIPGASYRAQGVISSSLIDAVPKTADRPDWVQAPLYIREHLVAHASAGGLLDSLLEDPGFLVAAAPSSLLPVLSQARSPRARQAARAYRTAADGLRTENLSERAAHLQLAAGKAGYWQMAEAFAAITLPWRWTMHVLSWQPPGHYTAIGNTGPSDYSAITVTAGGEVLVITASETTVITLWRGDDNGLSQVGDPQFDPDYAWVWAVALGQVGEWPVALTGHDGRVDMWRIGQDTLTLIDQVQAGQRPVAVGQCGRQTVAITSGRGDKVALWQVRKDRLKRVDEQPAHGGAGLVAAAVGQHGGRTVAVTGCLDGTVALWQVGQNGLTPIGNPQPGHTGPVWAMAVGQLGGQTVAVTSGLDALRLWKVGKDGLTPIGDPRAGHGGAVRAMAVRQFGIQTVVVTGDEEGRVALWRGDENGLTPIGDPQRGHGGPVGAMTVGQLGGQSVAVSHGRDGTVRVWQIDEDDLATTSGPPPSQGNSRITAAATGRLHDQTVVVTGHKDGTVALWELRENQLTPIGTPQCVYDGFEVETVAIGQVGGQTVAVTGQEAGIVQLWQLSRDALTPIGGITDGDRGLKAAAIGQVGDRTMAVTGGESGTMTLWQVGKNGLRLIGDAPHSHRTKLWALAIGQMSHQTVAITGGEWGGVALWRVSKNRLTPIGDVRVSQGLLWVTAAALGQFGGRRVAVTGEQDGTVTDGQLAEDGLAMIGESQHSHGGAKVGRRRLGNSAAGQW